MEESRIIHKLGTCRSKQACRRPMANHAEKHFSAQHEHENAGNVECGMGNGEWGLHGDMHALPRLLHEALQ